MHVHLQTKNKIKNSNYKMVCPRLYGRRGESAEAFDNYI
jgi:hypothetical protein